MFSQRAISAAFGIVLASGCGGDSGTVDVDGSVPDAMPVPLDGAVLGEQVSVLQTFDPSVFNQDIVADIPTMDVAFYFTEGGPLDWDDLAGSIRRAQTIYGRVGVQIRVSAAMQISVPTDWQTLEADPLEMPTSDGALDIDLYARIAEQNERLGERNNNIFSAIVAQFPSQDNGVDASRTIHAITLREVPIGFYEWSGTEWVYDSVPTGGLSFPPYIFADRIPEHLRGVITLSFRQSVMQNNTRTLSHEIGHKTLNVSHEGTGVCPAFEVQGDDLMLYGSGETIPEGQAGRFHKERLLRSPFLYTVDTAGQAVFANHFQDGGIYSDGLYGDFVVTPVCEPM